MKFYIRINCGDEVYFIGHEKGHHFGRRPPTDRGRWKIDLVKLESRLGRYLSRKKFGSAVVEYSFRFEVADFEKYGLWFSSDGNKVIYRPKSHSVESVGQLRWGDVKYLSASSQYARLKLAIVSSIQNVIHARRKPKDFDTHAFLVAVSESLERLRVSDVKAVRAT